MNIYVFQFQADNVEFIKSHAVEFDEMEIEIYCGTLFKFRVELRKQKFDIHKAASLGKAIIFSAEINNLEEQLKTNIHCNFIKKGKTDVYGMSQLEYNCDVKELKENKYFKSSLSYNIVNKNNEKIGEYKVNMLLVYFEEMIELPISFLTSQITIRMPFDSNKLGASPSQATAAVQQENWEPIFQSIAKPKRSFIHPSMEFYADIATSHHVPVFTDLLTPQYINEHLCGHKECPGAIKFKEFGLGPLAPEGSGLGTIKSIKKTKPEGVYGMSQAYGTMENYGAYGLFVKKKKGNNNTCGSPDCPFTEIDTDSTERIEVEQKTSDRTKRCTCKKCGKYTNQSSCITPEINNCGSPNCPKAAPKQEIPREPRECPYLKRLNNHRRQSAGSDIYPAVWHKQETQTLYRKCEKKPSTAPKYLLVERVCDEKSHYKTVPNKNEKTSKCYFCSMNAREKNEAKREKDCCDGRPHTVPKYLILERINDEENYYKNISKNQYETRRYANERKKYYPRPQTAPDNPNLKNPNHNKNKHDKYTYSFYEEKQTLNQRPQTAPMYDDMYNIHGRRNSEEIEINEPTYPSREEIYEPADEAPILPKNKHRKKNRTYYENKDTVHKSNITPNYNILDGIFVNKKKSTFEMSDKRKINEKKPKSETVKKFLSEKYHQKIPKQESEHAENSNNNLDSILFYDNLKREIITQLKKLPDYKEKASNYVYLEKIINEKCVMRHQKNKDYISEDLKRPSTTPKYNKNLCKYNTQNDEKHFFSYQEKKLLVEKESQTIETKMPAQNRNVSFNWNYKRSNNVETSPKQLNYNCKNCNETNQKVTINKNLYVNEKRPQTVGNYERRNNVRTIRDQSDEYSNYHSKKQLVNRNNTPCSENPQYSSKYKISLKMNYENTSIEPQPESKLKIMQPQEKRKPFLIKSSTSKKVKYEHSKNDSKYKTAPKEVENKYRPCTSKPRNFDDYRSVKPEPSVKFIKNHSPCHHHQENPVQIKVRPKTATKGVMTDRRSDDKQIKQQTDKTNFYKVSDLLTNSFLRKENDSLVNKKTKTTHTTRQSAGADKINPKNNSVKVKKIPFEKQYSLSHDSIFELSKRKSKKNNLLLKPNQQTFTNDKIFLNGNMVKVQSIEIKNVLEIQEKQPIKQKICRRSYTFFKDHEKQNETENIACIYKTIGGVEACNQDIFDRQSAGEDKISLSNNTDKTKNKYENIPKKHEIDRLSNNYQAKNVNKIIFDVETSKGKFKKVEDNFNNNDSIRKFLKTKYKKQKRKQSYHYLEKKENMPETQNLQLENISEKSNYELSNNNKLPKQIERKTSKCNCHLSKLKKKNKKKCSLEEFSNQLSQRLKDLNFTPPKHKINYPDVENITDTSTKNYETLVEPKTKHNQLMKIRKKRALKVKNRQQAGADEFSFKCFETKCPYPCQVNKNNNAGGCGQPSCPFSKKLPPETFKETNNCQDIECPFAQKLSKEKNCQDIECPFYTSEENGNIDDEIYKGVIKTEAGSKPMTLLVNEEAEGQTAILFDTAIEGFTKEQLKLLQNLPESNKEFLASIGNNPEIYDIISRLIANRETTYSLHNYLFPEDGGRESFDYYKKHKRHSKEPKEKKKYTYPCTKDSCKHLNYKLCSECGGYSRSGATCDNTDVSFSTISYSDTFNTSVGQDGLENKPPVEKNVLKNGDKTKKAVRHSVKIVRNVKKKTRFVYHAGEIYPGIRLGHKTCVTNDKNVPAHMGWLWNIKHVWEKRVLHYFIFPQ